MSTISPIAESTVSCSIWPGAATARDDLVTTVLQLEKQAHFQICSCPLSLENKNQNTHPFYHRLILLPENFSVTFVVFSFRFFYWSRAPHLHLNHRNSNNSTVRLLLNRIHPTCWFSFSFVCCTLGSFLLYLFLVALVLAEQLRRSGCQSERPWII